MKCHIYEICYLRFVLSMKCLSIKCLFMKCLSMKCPNTDIDTLNDSTYRQFYIDASF